MGLYVAVTPKCKAAGTDLQFFFLCMATAIILYVIYDRLCQPICIYTLSVTAIMYSSYCSHGSTGHKIYIYIYSLLPFSCHIISALYHPVTIVIISFLSHMPNFGQVHLICVTLKLYPSIYLSTECILPYSVMLGINAPSNSNQILVWRAQDECDIFILEQTITGSEN